MGDFKVGNDLKGAGHQQAQTGADTYAQRDPDG